MEPLLENAKIHVQGLPEVSTDNALRSSSEGHRRYGWADRKAEEFRVRVVRGRGQCKGSSCGCGGACDLVEVKEVISRERSPIQGIERENCLYSESIRNNLRYSKKIFVGGLPSDLTIDEFKSFFESYGQTTDVVIIVDDASRMSRGFGFVTYESEESARAVLRTSRYLIRGKEVEVKVAIPKETANTTEHPNVHSRHHPSNGANGYHHDSSFLGMNRGLPYANSAPIYPYANGMVTTSPAYAYGMVAPSHAYVNSLVTTSPAYAYGTVAPSHAYVNSIVTTSPAYAYGTAAPSHAYVNSIVTTSPAYAYGTAAPSHAYVNSMVTTSPAYAYSAPGPSHAYANGMVTTSPAYAYGAPGPSHAYANGMVTTSPAYAYSVPAPSLTYTNGMVTTSPAYAYGTPAPSPAFANSIVNEFHAYNGHARTASNGYNMATRPFTKIRISKPPGINGENSAGSSSASCAVGPSPASKDSNLDGCLSPLVLDDGKDQASSLANGQSDS